MKIKTSELTDDALDYAVAEAAKFRRTGASWGHLIDRYPRGQRVRYGWTSFSPSTNWSQGGPIIERESINLHHFKFDQPSYWTAHIELAKGRTGAHGPTLLIAAMRCYVASKLGDEVDVPEELL